eukprot:superscaffoldBa00002246_g13643
MASGKKSALLSSLADYGDDTEPDSDPEPEDTGIRAGLVYSYGDDDLNRTEDVEDKVSGDEDSRESNSEMDESDEGRDADDVELCELDSMPTSCCALWYRSPRSQKQKKKTPMS